MMAGYRADRLDLSEIFFSNEEYYSKLEELKRAHLRTMAELESMYRRKLQLRSAERLDAATLETGHRWGGGGRGGYYVRDQLCWVSHVWVFVSGLVIVWL